MTASLPFPAKPKARSTLKAGYVYAVDAGDSYIYYSQIDYERNFGFFRFRSKEIDLDAALNSELMCRVGVAYASVGRAIRSGEWLGLGLYAMHSELEEAAITVQWPVGTTKVTLWKNGEPQKKVEVHDPGIQNLEVMSAFDASYHIPNRIRAEYNRDLQNLTIYGGRVIDHRRDKEKTAEDSPDVSWHQLPGNWVFVDSNH